MIATSRVASLRQFLSSATILAGIAAAPAFAQTPSPLRQTTVPSGQMISPMSAHGSVFQDFNPELADMPDFRAGEAIKTAVSPDGGTLLVLTSGYNNLNEAANVNASDYSYLEPQDSNEYVFVYSIFGDSVANPRLKQVIQIPDTFEGLAFAADSKTFYVSGGVDDVVYRYDNSGGKWGQTASINLGHAALMGVTPVSNGGIGFLQSPSAAGLALSADGKSLAVANIYNESVSLISTASNTVTTEYDLRPYNTSGAAGQGLAGGETPFTVKIAGNDMLYVSSIRDREIVVLNISTGTPTFVTRIPMTGNPNSMAFDNDAKPTRLYVAQDNTDYVAVINLKNNSVIEQIDAIGPASVTHTTERYTGAASNNLVVSRDGQTLYVTNGGQNAVAVVPLVGQPPHVATGLIPTGWYPHAVSISNSGSHLYVTNGKSNPGANPQWLTGSTYALHGTTYPGGNSNDSNQAYASSEYVFQLEKAGLLSLPIPNASQLAGLTKQVAANNL